MMAMSDTKAHIHITPNISFLFIESEIGEPFLAIGGAEPYKDADTDHEC